MGIHSRKVWFWLGLGVVFCIFLYLISSILLPFVLGIMIAYFLDPAARWLEKKGMSRLTATSLLIIGFFGALLLFVLALSPLLYKQIVGLIDSIPDYFERVREYLEPKIKEVMNSLPAAKTTNPQEVISKASGSLMEWLRNIAVGIFASGAAFVNAVTLLLLTPVVAFYLLRDWQRIIDNVDGLLPRENAPVIRQQMREIDRTIAGYLRGQVNVCLLLALFYMVGLGLTGLNYGVLIGLISGLISFIPFIGALLGFAVSMLIAFFQFSDFWPIAAVAIVYGLGQALEGNVLVPKLVGEKVGLHPAWVIFGMLAGGVLLGFVGVLLAVPISAVIGVLVRFAIEHYRTSQIYYGDEEPVLLPAPAAAAPVAKKAPAARSTPRATAASKAKPKPKPKSSPRKKTGKS